MHSRKKWVVCARGHGARELEIVRRGALPPSLALGAALLSAAPASADFPTVFEGDVTCVAQPANGNVRLCGGPTTTWDGQTKIDVNVILPPAPTSGPDGPYPLIGDFHGWGGSKIGIEDQTQGWAEERLRGVQHERPRLGQLLRRRGPGQTGPDANAARATTT